MEGEFYYKYKIMKKKYIQLKKNKLLGGGGALDRRVVILEGGLNYVIFADTRQIVPLDTVLWHDDTKLGTLSSIRVLSRNLEIKYKDAPKNVQERASSEIKKLECPKE